MHDKDAARSDQELSAEDLAGETAVDLPDREAMSTIGHGFGSHVGNIAVPINEATASNINSVNSIAVADADQIVILDQDTVVEGKK
jgi:hypothetical protein